MELSLVNSERDVYIPVKFLVEGSLLRSASIVLGSLVERHQFLLDLIA